MKTNTVKLVMLGILTALVVVLQLLSSSIRFGQFSITLTLVPIVVGAALYGKWAGAWLGAVFGVVVLLQPDTMAFYQVSIPGTVITVLAKGILAGFVSGLVYEVLKKKNDTAATFVAGALTPIVNTGVFVLGCFAFFMDTLKEWAGGKNVFAFLFLSMIGVNFLIEFGVNLVLGPMIAKIIKIGRKKRI
ncbi:MAG: ECF transporter S component [Clostridia bacterium]|nr:ECF transporter S component [Clostridia bacterium]